MNLPYTYELLAAADEQRHGFIKLRGTQADHEVRLMARAGLAEATFGDGKEGSFTSINRVTETGQTFLHTFKDHTIPAEATLDKSITASQSPVAVKWKSYFDLNLLAFRRAE
jgi:hypothetical protein